MREASAYLIVAIRSASELPADGAPFAINLYLKCKQESGRRQGFSNDRVGGGLPRPPEWVPRFIMDRHAGLELGGATDLLECGLDDRLILESMGCSVTSNKPFKWTGHHQLSATPPQTPCLPLRGSAQVMPQPINRPSPGVWWIRSACCWRLCRSSPSSSCIPAAFQRNLSDHPQTSGH